MHRQHNIKFWFMPKMLIYVGSVHSLKENAQVLFVAGKDIVLEVNSDKAKYMVMSRDQNEE